MINQDEIDLLNADWDLALKDFITRQVKGAYLTTAPGDEETWGNWKVRVAACCNDVAETGWTIHATTIATVGGVHWSRDATGGRDGVWPMIEDTFLVEYEYPDEEVM